ncbi:MAG: deoxyribose-phosphate aldolase [Rectinemataceae bacterium]
MSLEPLNIASLIDVSVLQTYNTEEDVRQLVHVACKYHFICAFALPSYSASLVKALENEDVLVGAPIGFPTGGEPPEVKAFQARLAYETGCDEFDMVMNVGLLKSKRFREVESDIASVYKEIGGKPLKVIVEAPYLSNVELEDACKIVMASGAQFVKSGTGWAPKPTEFRHIEIMARTVDGKVKIKAAGGIRDLDTLRRMQGMGVSRFGIGVNSALAIIKEAGEKVEGD